MAKKRKKQKKDVGLIVSFSATMTLLAVFVFALFMFTFERLQNNKSAATYQEVNSLVSATREPVQTPDISDLIAKAAATRQPTAEPTATPDPNTTPDPDATPTPVPTAAPEPTVQPRLAELYEANHDLIGWVTIPDTNIDYPVMYTPQEKWYYLKKDFYGNYSSPGVPFLDEQCAPEDAVWLIHGHHRKDRSMFTQVGDYVKQSFWEAHPYILLDTLTEARVYVIFAAVQTRIFEPQYKDVFRYHDLDVLSQESFEAYMGEMKALSLYDTGIDVEWGDEVVMLSTCSYHTTEGRFVLVAKRIA